jgi:hypothetical protein
LVDIEEQASAIEESGHHCMNFKPGDSVPPAISSRCQSRPASSPLAARSPVPARPMPAPQLAQRSFARKVGSETAKPQSQSHGDLAIVNGLETRPGIRPSYSRDQPMSTTDFSKVSVGEDLLDRMDPWHCPGLRRTEVWECADRRRGVVETGGGVRPDTSRRRSRNCQTDG